MIQAIGTMAFDHAANLRYFSRLHVLGDDQPITRPPCPITPENIRRSLSPQVLSPNKDLAIAKLVPDLDLGPWESALIPTRLPDLPKVLDPALEAGAFIHQGSTSGKATDVSYERLEWIGDSYIYLLSSILISKTFPALLPGKCSQLRERLVKNVTLADYARSYGFDKRAKLPNSFSFNAFRQSKDTEKTKVLGDIFEAYVAAVVLSDPEDGIRRVCAWLKDLWGMTLRKEIIKEEESSVKVASPLWDRNPAPGSGFAQPATASALPQNPKERLQQLLGSKGVKIEYKDAAAVKKDKDTKLPLFTVGVYLSGWGEKNRLLGTGTAHGKKDAGMKAATMALENRKAMDTYLEKKRVFDAQLELERKALDKANA